jgi:homopolymeric O-antigen transport system ATP-binding protein
MSADDAITVRGLGKRYVLGQQAGGYQLLSEQLGRRLRSVGASRPRREEFWALRGLDFTVRRGETFGIIGHNGAGKSTLLKLLSRVTPPTEGELRLHGRVGALLEVGTGFHPELSGRENIYLNGAILGMRRHEIASKFDEIVEFAEVSAFIDTPVKRYSSGMYLRLAFAVAAHLEPEILIVDEVLSVGDLRFQEKCMGRMEAVAGQGRTVLFVSHNLTAVSKLCERSIMLAHGAKIAEGSTEDVIATYVQHARKDADVELDTRSDRQGTGRMRFRHVHVESGGLVVDSPISGQDCELVLTYASDDGRPLRNVNFAILVASFLGVTMLHLYSETRGAQLGEIPPQGEVRCRLPRCPLPAGQYTLNLWADVGGEVLDWIQRAAELTVVEGDFYRSGRGQPSSHQSVLVEHDWEVRAA